MCVKACKHSVASETNNADPVVLTLLTGSFSVPSKVQDLIGQECFPRTAASFSGVFFVYFGVTPHAV